MLRAPEGALSFCLKKPYLAIMETKIIKGTYSVNGKYIVLVTGDNEESLWKLRTPWDISDQVRQIEDKELEDAILKLIKKTWYDLPGRSRP